MGLKTWWQNFLNLVFPPRCLLCRSPGEELVCSRCNSQVKFIKTKEFTGGLDGVYSATSYEGQIKKAIHIFKFKKRQKLKFWLGQKFIQGLPRLGFQDFDLISYIPVSKKRLKERGFNQAKLLAEIVAEELKLPCRETICRAKETRPQFELKREERIKNMAGAFKITQKNNILKRKILVVDDIYTTGTTLRECGKVLKSSGAAEVVGLTLAKTV